MLANYWRIPKYLLRRRRLSPIFKTRLPIIVQMTLSKHIIEWQAGTQDKRVNNTCTSTSSPLGLSSICPTHYNMKCCLSTGLNSQSAFCLSCILKTWCGDVSGPALSSRFPIFTSWPWKTLKGEVIWCVSKLPLQHHTIAMTGVTFRLFYWSDLLLYLGIHILFDIYPI